MGILSRVVALELMYGQEMKGLAYYESLGDEGKWMLALNAHDRNLSRTRRYLRAYLEARIMEISEGHPPAFDQALEETLGLLELDGISRWGSGAMSVGGLWEPWGIRVEDCHLRGEWGTREQEDIDAEILRRYYSAKGVKHLASDDDIRAFLAILDAGFERLRVQLDQRVGRPGANA